MRHGRRRKQSNPRAAVGVALLAVVAVGGWWLFFYDGPSTQTRSPNGAATADSMAQDDTDGFVVPELGEPAEPSRLAGDAHEEILRPRDANGAPIASSKQPTDTGGAETPEPIVSADPPTFTSEPQEADNDTPSEDAPDDTNADWLAKARRMIESGELVAARRELNRHLRYARSPADQRVARRLLTQASTETILGKRRFEDDPLVERYRVQSGDYLIHIAPRFKVPAEGIMLINGIKDAKQLRAGQVLKIPRGPFHAVIDKSAFRLDLYLGDTFVKSMPVGLGKEHGTPEGKWVVENRLDNPTYFPPASAPEKEIIHGNDPKNPLGEYWIGLEGVEGDAVGREGYGIHGTIEPESIGQAASLGCVRLHDEDIALLFRLLMPKHSTVQIVP